VSGVPFCCHKLTTPLALLPAVPQPPAQCPSPRACVCVSSVGRLPAPRSPGPAARVHCHTHTMALPSCLPACSAHRDKSERKRGPDQLLGPGYTPAHWTPDPGARARVATSAGRGAHAPAAVPAPAPPLGEAAPFSAGHRTHAAYACAAPRAGRTPRTMPPLAGDALAATTGNPRDATGEAGRSLHAGA
jgi:hypothetical protein